MTNQEKSKVSHPTRIQPPRGCKRSRPAEATESRTTALTRKTPYRPDHTTLAEPEDIGRVSNTKKLPEPPASRQRPTGLEKPFKGTIRSAVLGSSVSASTSAGEQSGQNIEAVKTTNSRTTAQPRERASRRHVGPLPRKQPSESTSASESQTVQTPLPHATSSERRQGRSIVVINPKDTSDHIITDTTKSTSKTPNRPSEESPTQMPEPSETVSFEVTDPNEVAKRKDELEIPERHKLIHFLRHGTAWCNVDPRPGEVEADLRQIHDPGLTPLGREESRLFPEYYKYHIKPTLIVSSPLRRCLQTTTIAFGPMIRSSKIRALAHPGLQEVSNDPCDTGTPLDVLREEFPDIQFPDKLFPRHYWPRKRSIPLRKPGTIYEDDPELLLERAADFRKWLREEVEDEEIIVVTHGGFVHFFYDQWDGVPGESGSEGAELGNAEAIPMTLDGTGLPDEGFCTCPLGINPGPHYRGLTIEDAADLANVHRDCGIFTPHRLR